MVSLQVGVNEYIDLKENELNKLNGIRSLYKGSKCPNGTTASGSTRVVAMAFENDVSAPSKLLTLPNYKNMDHSVLQPHLPSINPPPAVPHILQAPTPGGL